MHARTNKLGFVGGMRGGVRETLLGKRAFPKTLPQTFNKNIKCSRFISLNGYNMYSYEGFWGRGQIFFIKTWTPCIMQGAGCIKLTSVWFNVTMHIFLQKGSTSHPPDKSKFEALAGDFLQISGPKKYFLKNLFICSHSVVIK